MYFGPSISVGRRGVSYGDSDAQAFIAATGLTGTTEVNAVNNLVANLKSYGLWSKMKAIYPFVSDTYNLLSYSEDFTNAAWSKNNGLTATANTTTAPDGTTTADTIEKLGGTGGSNYYYIVQGSSFAQLTNFFYVKYKSGSGIVWLLGPNSGSFAYYDIINGTTLSKSSGMTTSIQSVGNGWYKCIFSQDYTGASSATFGIGVCLVDGTPNYNATSAATQSVYIWGAQSTIGTSALTYQPITTTPANRFVSQFKYNLKDARDLDAAFRLAFNGAWTYSKQGATPNGVNAFSNTYLTPSTSLGSTFSLSYYSNTDTTSASPVCCEIGAFQSGLQMIGLSLRRNLSADMFGTDGYGQTASSTSTTSNFFGIASRSSTTSLKLWKNTTLSATNTSLDGGSKPTIQITLALNNGLTGYSNRRCAFSHIGDGLSDTEVANLYTTVQTFETELSRYVGVPIVSDANAQAFLDAAVITDQTQANAVNTLVTDLKTYGIWSKMKAIYPFVSDQRNLIGYTEDFTNAAWTKSGGTATANTTTAPDGTTTADTFTENTANTVHTIYQPFSSITGNQYTFSCYVKENGRNIVRFQCQATAVLYQVEFNLTTVTTSNFSGTGTAAITSVGNGWYRCSATITSTATGTGYWQLDLCSGSGTNTYLGNGTSGVYLWGAQVDLGALTTYQKTSTTASSVFVQQFKYNLKDARDLDAAFRLAFNGTWTYSKQGATPNGVNAFSNTFFKPSNSTYTNFNFGHYLTTNSVGVYAEFGLNQTDTYVVYDYPNLSGTAYVKYGSSDNTYTPTNTTGFSSYNQSSNQLKRFKNGVLMNTFANTPANLSLTTLSYYLASRNVDGTAAQFSNRTRTFHYMSDGLTDTEATNLYTSVQLFQQALNRQV